MSQGITLALIGAGSSYTPELIEGILDQDEAILPISQIRLYDINTERLDIMAGLSKRMILKRNKKIALHHGSQLDATLDGADFVISQIRVGGMTGRYQDESIPLRHSIIGQETTGPGGMFKAMRTIPAMLEIAHAVERYCPEAFILNYTNPSGIVTEAVLKHSRAKILGLCSGIPGMQNLIHEKVSPFFPAITSQCIGLNHLGFIHRIYSNGTDITTQALEHVYQGQATLDAHGHMTEAGLARLIRAMPIAYVNYFLLRNKKVREASAVVKTRAQQILEYEQELFAQAADTAIDTKPPVLAKRGGGGYSSITFSVLRAILHNSGELLPVNVLNQGAIIGLPDDGVSEIICSIGKNGATPLPVGEIPLAFRGLVQAVKTYETLAVEAAITKKRDTAIMALAAHPLCGDLDTAVQLVDQLAYAHGIKLTAGIVA